MELMLVLILIGLTLLISKLFFGTKTQKYPGPGFVESFLGLIKYKENLHIILTEWAQKYGNFYSVFLGPDPYFILSESSLVKEAFNNADCAGRPTVPPLDPYFKGSKGIIGTNGPQWLDHRNFSIATLRSFGLGSTQMSKKMSQEGSLFLDFLDEHQGRPFTINKQFMISSFNALWIMVANRTFSRKEDDETIQMFAHHLGLLKKVSQNPLIMFNERIAKLVPWLSSWSQFRTSYCKLSAYFDKVIEEHAATRVKGQPRDFIDSYLDNCDDVTDSNSVFYEATHLKTIVFDFFYVGSNNASTTMEWVILHMIRNPAVQFKVRLELLNIVGPHQAPQLSDRAKLPYLEATLNEVMRLTPTASTGIPHQVLNDFKLGDHVLTKGSNVMANVFRIHRDPSVWNNPEEFQPERFLTNGKAKQSDNFMPFSIGKRACIGRGFANDFVFLLTAQIFHSFELTIPPKSDMPNLESAGGVALTPKEFRVVAKRIN